MSWSKETRSGFGGGEVIYRCRNMNDSNVLQAFSTKTNGNMALHTGDDPEKVLQRRRTFLGTLGLELKCLVAGVQTHSVNVRLVTRQLAGAGAWDLATAVPDTDAFITRESGIILSIFTADCLPIFIYDPVTPSIGLAHAGWRGTLNRIAAKTLEEMVAVFHTNPSQCRVAIGPAIGTECFAVTEDVAGQFAAIFPETVHFDNSNYRVDLSEFNQKTLRNMGVPGQQITGSGLCTSCLREDFYSYRAENRTTGRMMGIISLRK
jgi:YfiH family protein